MKDADYFAENPEQFDELTDDQKELIFQGGSVDEGDTETDATEEAEAEQEATETESSETPDADEDSEETPEEKPDVLAKDGKHTIPYSELEDARERAAKWEQFAVEQQRLIDDLKAAKEEDAGTGTTDAQDEVIAQFEEDFPELTDYKPFIQKMIDDGIKAGIADFERKVEERITPIQQNAELTARERYFNEIAAVHPDYEQVAASQEFSDWFDKQPSFIRDQIGAIWQQGTPGQVNEVFSLYKDAVKPVETPEPEEAKVDPAKAKDIIAETKPKAPNSLSDVPATITGAHDEAEAMLNMSQSQLEAKFANKSPEEIMKLVSKLV